MDYWILVIGEICVENIELYNVCYVVGVFIGLFEVLIGFIFISNVDICFFDFNVILGMVVMVDYVCFLKYESIVVEYVDV